MAPPSSASSMETINIKGIFSLSVALWSVFFQVDHECKSQDVMKYDIYLKLPECAAVLHRQRGRVTRKTRAMCGRKWETLRCVSSESVWQPWRGSAVFAFCSMRYSCAVQNMPALIIWREQILRPDSTRLNGALKLASSLYQNSTT